MDYLVLIPTYNEFQNLPELIRRLFSLGLPNLKALVIDDASPDGTGQLAQSLSSAYGGRIQVLSRPRKLGLGSAYAAGYHTALETGASVIVQMDADLSHPPEVLPEMLKHMNQYDIVIASRYVPGGGVDPSWGLSRRLLSQGGNAYARLVTGIPVRDSTSGFRCFRGEALRKLDLREFKCQSFAFQVEIAYYCWKAGLSIYEAPYVFRDRSHGVSKISPATVGEALWRLPQLRLRNLR